jgi:sugar phosphate permease
VRVGRDWRHLALVAGTAVILVAASLVWALRNRPQGCISRDVDGVHDGAAG